MLVLQTVQIAKVMPMTCTTTALQTQCRHHLNHDQAEAGKTPKFFVANGMPSTFTDSPIQERKLRQAAGEGDLLSGLSDELGYWSAARWPLQGRFRLGAAKCPEGRAPCESPRLRGALLPGCSCAQRYDLVPIAFTTWLALKAKIQQDIFGRPGFIPGSQRRRTGFAPQNRQATVPSSGPGTGPDCGRIARRDFRVYLQCRDSTL